MDWQNWYKLKSLARAGWLRNGIEHPESVAAHSWGVALLCHEHCPDHLNRERVLQLAIIHDLPEVYVGDITPHDGISQEKKHFLEMQAAQNFLPEKTYAIWLEYLENQSPEARFVHAIDKIDMALQARFYEDEYKIDGKEFLQSAQKALGQEWQYLWSIVENGIK